MNLPLFYLYSLCDIIAMKINNVTDSREFRPSIIIGERSGEIGPVTDGDSSARVIGWGEEVLSSQAVIDASQGKKTCKTHQDPSLRVSHT
jgi:hypothetical protein